MNQTSQSDTPLVSIRCITYNHETYIRQCLEGFVMQKTNFKFEAIVHDDASTDGTAAIIREFAEKYPDIIKPIYETENQYSKHDGSLRRIMNNAIHPDAKYIAMCEGDDYWTDPLKLQKQVDFLESHPDYSLCFHNAIKHFQDGSQEDCLFAEVATREYDRYELFLNWTASTASFVFRKSILESVYNDKIGMTTKILTGDLCIVMNASYCGKIYGLSDVMSVYRTSNEGVLISVMAKRPDLMLQNYLELKNIFPEDLHVYIDKKISQYASISISMIRNGQKKQGKILWKAVYRYSSWLAIKGSVNYFINGVMFKLKRR